MKKNGSSKKGSVALVVLFVVLAVLVLGAVAVYAGYKHYYRMSNYEEPTTMEESLASSVAEELLETAETVAQEEEESIQAEIESALETKETVPEDEQDDIYNILLIGADRRDKSWNGNSDAMVLMTINYTDEKVMLTSFMRDLGANVEGYGLKKLNFAYAIGAGPCLVKTIEDNFGVGIDNYAWVDFDTLVQLVDTLNGIDLVLNPQEAQFVGLSISEAQSLHLNGNQVLLYARDRRTGGSDFHRTQRHRNVIMAILQRVRSGSLGDVVTVANSVIPLISHDISEKQMTKLLLNLPAIVKYDFSEQRVPYDNTYYSQNEILIPDYEYTINMLHETIYD